MRELTPYQTIGIDKLAHKASLGLRRLAFQMATGSGKTVTFAGLINRFLVKQQKKVVILVHREELLVQASRTIFEWYDITAAPVTAETKYLPNVMVYVAMVETANNRLKKNPDYFGSNIGLLIVDECHRGEHKKLYPYFPTSLILGFTATPISGDRKDPLKNYFDELVCGIDIPELFEIWRKNPKRGLVPNKTYHIQNIDRKKLSISKGDFDNTEMGNVFSSTKHVLNTLKAYEEFCKGTKTVVFNCNIAHSKKVNEAFLSYGYKSRHLDGTTSKEERKDIFRWLKLTPDAILQNVDVATTGFDETSLISGIINRSTMSLALWLQMAGRMARPHDGKDFFNLIDMGGNALYHGDWSQSRDWYDMFHNPQKIGTGGEAPLKSCICCHVIIHLSQKICPHCGAINASVVKYDEGIVKFELLQSNKPIEIDVQGHINEYAGKVKSDGQPYKEISVLHVIKYKIVTHAGRIWRLKKIDDKTAYKLIDIYQDKVKEWVKIKGSKYDWCVRSSKDWMMAELKRVFHWEPQQIKAA